MKKNGFGKFIAGAAVGAGLGLLFAPKTGKETREILKKKFDEVLEQVKSIKAEDVKASIVKKVISFRKLLLPHIKCEKTKGIFPFACFR